MGDEGVGEPSPSSSVLLALFLSNILFPTNWLTLGWLRGCFNLRLQLFTHFAGMARIAIERVAQEIPKGQTWMEGSCKQWETLLEKRITPRPSWKRLEALPLMKAPFHGPMPHLLQPQKIFLWDAHGVYLDCAFPNPVHGHFCGGVNVRGAHLRDLFPQTTTQYILQGLTKALAQQARQHLAVAFQRQDIFFRTDILLIPMDQAVLGWVMNQPVTKKTRLTLVGSAPHLSKDRMALVALLTPREQQVAQAFGSGRSNRQIAKALTMSDRAVKFHMENLLHKLHLPSRAHLVHLHLFDSTMLC